jgi:negative regulator of flagellin synthesis FlgM
MMINGINSINPLNNVQETRKSEGISKARATESDSISVSKEAEKMAEAYYLDKVAAETPDVRADRVAEVREKIKDPSYLNDAVFGSAADKFLSALGL